MSTITIYHNPDCGTSRNTLALIRAAGVEPTVIEYLKTPPSRDTLKALIARMGMRARDVLRIKGTPYKALGLDRPDLPDEPLIDAMRAHPILINRPVVVSPHGVRLCRPSDEVIDLLPVRPTQEVLKDDGTPFLAVTPIEGSDAGLLQTLTAEGLATGDLTDPGRRFFRFAILSPHPSADEPVGYGGFEPLGADALMRSLVVLPAARHRGIGRGMLALLLRRAFDAGAREAWLLTTTAAAFFERAGFTAVERASAPVPVLATRQAAGLCAASAALMRRAITL